MESFINWNICLLKIAYSDHCEITSNPHELDKLLRRNKGRGSRALWELPEPHTPLFSLKIHIILTINIKIVQTPLWSYGLSSLFVSAICDEPRLTHAII